MSEPIISVEHVHKSVTDSTGTLDILRDIDFTLAPRETAAIVGASGSGKSTLLSIIAGLDTPTRGTVRLAGQDIFALDEDDRAALRAQKVGFVFQSFQLMGNLNALENVMLPLELAGRKDSRKAATDMLARVGLSSRLGHYPRVLSGGEQQRVALARAFIAAWMESSQHDTPLRPAVEPDQYVIYLDSVGPGDKPETIERMKRQGWELMLDESGQPDGRLIFRNVDRLNEGREQNT